MNVKTMIRRSAAGLLLPVVMAGAASAAQVSISITNEQGAGGLYLTPLLVALHDSGFDAFDAGDPASLALQALAEEGMTGALEAEATAAGATTGVITSPGGFAPIIDPGETAKIKLTVDPTDGRFLSFFSMVIPSNDMFIGNDNSMAYEVFDAVGAFTNLGPISILLSDVWDAGSEVNDNEGAAFNNAGGIGTDENGVVALNDGGIFGLNGQVTAALTTVNIGSDPSQLLATITVEQVPLPAGFPLLLAGLGGIGLMARRRR